LAGDVLGLLQARAETLACAESLTGGMLAQQITAVPGASAAFVGAVVSYATAIKTGVLGVPPAVVATHGVVSAPCAQAMAVGARALLGSTWAMATTGVAGPTEQEGQPVGTVFVAVDGPHPVVRRLRLAGDRERIRELTCQAALLLLLEQIALAPS